MFSFCGRWTRSRRGNSCHDNCSNPWSLQPAHPTSSSSSSSSSSKTGGGGDGGSGGGGGKGEPEGPERLARVVAASFSKHPRTTALAILSQLTELDRVYLLLALQQSTSKTLLQRQSTAYVDDLMKQKRFSEHHAGLTKSQIANAVEYQRVLQKFSSYSVDVPSAKQLVMVAAASGLPFVGFGFTDNAIMLVAGEQIDVLFGARMGISTLASAALGNLVADIVGVSVTHQIQAASKHVKWAQPPRLSVLQQSLSRVKAAKLGGVVLGVTIGCIAGMIPLAFMPEPERHHSRSHGHQQQQQQQEEQQQQQEQRPASAR